MSIGRQGEGDGLEPRFDLHEPLWIDPDPVAQWLDWGEQADPLGFRTSVAPVEVPVAWVPREEVEVHILPGAAPEIVDLRTGGTGVWPDLFRVRADDGSIYILRYDLNARRWRLHFFCEG